MPVATKNPARPVDARDDDRRGKTIHEIMSVSGHLTMKEVERYTRMADRARNARAAMAGRV
jgi:hypothetical protein